ncbi:MAG TPA: aconitate hydratase [Polyangiaceae bacterium]|nr:aconitate hydratase [Polyangiaceae bacterium]HNZ23753.1 aconitate hydratase [Polyangiaceae bacterium]HOD23070.1 aconitate hydratase [Polyangiaceae bacterium]HOE48978.1 aconitate hydratase [Polyangiaceae bacterium]HOH01522.1 aconitate hydratase [Polyangiaceae bacterium]
MKNTPALTEASVRQVYERQAQRHEWARNLLGRPLTLAEKILFAHVKPYPDAAPKDFTRLKSSTQLWPDRVTLQDATAQMAILQFMQAGVPRVAVPSTVHCDHLIQAQQGAQKDLLRAFDENQEVYDFLASASKKYGLGFWQPGAGIIHQVVLENYAFPGALIIGTDSHTPNGGGLGMLAIGVGGADAVDVMVGAPFGLRWPGVIGVRLTGKLSGWTAPKDVILHLMGILTTRGGTGHIVEFFGPGTASLSATGKGTICNMGAEHGATTSVFPFDQAMAVYLRATGREAIAALAEQHASELRADKQVEDDPERFYDRVIEIDLDTLEPHINGPHSPDRAYPISKLAEAIASESWPDKLSATLIGSCTNSSYEDMVRSAAVVQAARAQGLKLASPLYVTPGSDQIFETLKRDGLLEIFENAGALVLANACGPCIGQWKREDIVQGQENTILNSYNRNFPRRNDGNPATLSFIGSPEIVTALAFAGRLSFNPMKDTLVAADGKTVRLQAPSPAENGGLPKAGFAHGLAGFIEPAEDGNDLEVLIDPKSKRLQRLEPFAPWDGKDFENLVVLLKATGKCTTDHISPAGPWLRFRGHIDAISDNMFLGANNAFTDKPGTAVSALSGENEVPIAALARAYRAQNIGWVAVGDWNYGEGSSREHAAMSPRFLGAKAVITRSFARIHETNLKKQGVLPLTFSNPADYDKIRADDRLNLLNLQALTPNGTVICRIDHADGSKEQIELKHSLDAEQIEWFKAGSALNVFAQR